MKIFIFITLSFFIFACQGDKKDHTGLKGKDISHRLMGDDYIISLRAYKDSLTHKQNRIKKVITFRVKGLIRAKTYNILTGTVKRLSINNDKGKSVIRVWLSRPVRYELVWLRDNNVNIILKNVMADNSLSPNKKVRDFHYRTFNIDLHNDLILHVMTRNISIQSGDRHTEIDLYKMKKGGARSCFYAVFVPPFFVKGNYAVRFKKSIIKRFSRYKNKPFDLALYMIDRLHKEMDKYSGINLALSSADLLNNFSRSRISGLIGLEGAHPLEGNVDRVKVLYDKGVRYIGLTWNNSNSFADAAGHNIHGGLSKLGRRLIKKMMSLGMLIDLSHSSDNTFYDVLKIAKTYPVILSHSSARGLVNHKRNITNNMLRTIRANGGVIGVIYHSKYLKKKAKASIEDVLNHIDYLVELSSVDNVALGSDYDGFIKTPRGLEDISKLASLSLGLYNRGYSFSDIKKILGTNFIRVFRAVEGYRKVKHTLDKNKAK